MPTVDLDELLRLLADPQVESLEIARLAGVPREQAGRAARLLAGLAKAKPEEVITLPAPLAAALSRAALSMGRAELLLALSRSTEKEVAKEAKRGLHVMKTRGVAVPEPPREPVWALKPAPVEAPFPAYTSAPDALGERAVWTCRNVPGKGVEVGQAILSDTRGVMEFEVGVIGRKEWRTFLGGLFEKGSSMAVAEIPFDRAHALIAEARGLNDGSGEQVPEGFDLWLSRLGPAPTPPDPAEGFEPLPEREEKEALETSASLHDLPLLRDWLADIDHLKSVAAELDQVAVSSLYIDENQRLEQAERVIATGIDSWLTPERRALFSRRLYVVARQLVACGDHDHAKIAAAAARALQGGLPARSIPFARLLVEKAFRTAKAASLLTSLSGEPSPSAEGRIDPPSLLR